MDYSKRQGEFSDDRMSLEMTAKLFATELSAQASCSKLVTKTFSQEQSRPHFSDQLDRVLCSVKTHPSDRVLERFS
jgi:hypothetical protein